MLSLVPVGLLLGVAVLGIFRVASNQEAIRLARRRLAARLYELRLFADEPLLVWRAQVGLLAANARYLGLMLVPALVLGIPMVLLYPHLEACYGMAPLPPGTAAIVTVGLRSPADPALPPPSLQAPDGIAIECPPVRVLADRQVTWRIRPLRPVSGALRISLPGETVEKNIVSGSGPHYLSARRVRSPLDWIWHPAESRLPQGPIDWIEVRYPSASVRWLGLELHWSVWLLAFSMLSALSLRKVFGVTF